LDNMSKGSFLTDKQKKICKARFEEAYNRGREWTVGDIYPFQEDIWHELKGMDEREWNRSGTGWKYSLFYNRFLAVAVKTLCAFVNHYCLTGRRPLVPARLVFGVTDFSRFMHGVCLPFQNDDKLQLHVQSEKAKLEQIFREALGGQISKVSRAMARKIGLASRIDLKPFTLQPDWPGGEQAFLITLELDFSNVELELCNPVMFGEDHVIFVRDIKPETRHATKDELEQLFVYGVPPCVKLRPSTPATKEYCEDDDCTEYVPCKIHAK